ncbi:MAG: M28 family peptidase [Flavisolibacter sp.]
MKNVFLSFILIASLGAGAQKAQNLINPGEVRRIETVLASDDMKGRKAGSPDIDRAAAFIAAEFKKAGLQPLKGNSYLQDFIMVQPKLVSVKGDIDQHPLDPQQVIVISQEPDLQVDEQSGYALQYIKEGEDIRSRVQMIMGLKKNAVVIVDTSFSGRFSRLAGLNRPHFQGDSNSAANTIFILGDHLPAQFHIRASMNLQEKKFTNVVGLLPGKNRKKEYVIFSGHYDHLGIGKPVAGDSIYNGANDDAAGTTAVIVLANYFKKLKNNARSLVFAAFTAEEVGGFGSQYFSRQFDPSQVMAMFNIEMIGTESKWGKNTAYITGFEKTNMGEILQRNLKGTAFHFYPDPYTQENLFYRSDNATLARQGVPAHTISTSKMDNEPHYHQVSDEVKTLDLENMAEIIKAIAQSSRSIISGKDTPTRVKTEDLQ